MTITDETKSSETWSEMFQHTGPRVYRDRAGNRAHSRVRQ